MPVGLVSVLRMRGVPSQIVANVCAVWREAGSLLCTITDQLHICMDLSSLLSTFAGWTRSKGDIAALPTSLLRL